MVGGKFDMDITDQRHSYTVYWTYSLTIIDENGKPVKNEQVKILDKNNSIAVQQKTGEDGQLSVELPEYSADGKEKTWKAPYTVRAGNVTEEVRLNRNTKSSLMLKARENN